MNKEEIQKDIKKYSSIEAVEKSDGGKLLIASLEKDIVSCIDELSAKIKIATHIELVAIVAKMSERLTLLRVIRRAKKLKNLATKELDFLLKEENE